MSDQPRGALLVGSVPLDTSEEVFRAAAGALGDRLRRIPDGEPGERDTWIVCQVGVFARSPHLEPVSRDNEGYAEVLPQFKLREGVDPATVDLTPLGYADAATASYATFRRLRDEGVVPAGVRFQVSLPTAFAPVASFVAASDQPVVDGIYADAMRSELGKIQALIPHEDLAIQWDLAFEPGVWEEAGGQFVTWFEPAKEGVLDRAAAMMNLVAPDVELGVHLCYGDFGHEHYLQPKDTGVVTAIANGLAERVRRPITWLHLPVPVDRDDPAYLAPLADLRLGPDTELYLGLVHAGDEEGTRRRIATAVAAGLAPFGVATECGMGRTPREQVDGLLRQHAAVSAVVAPR